MPDYTAIKDANSNSPNPRSGNKSQTLDLPKTLGGVPSDTLKVEALNIAINAFDVIGTIVGRDEALAWANNALVNTEVVVTVPHPGKRNQYYALTVYNPSTGSDLTCRVYQKKHNLGGADRQAYVTSFTFPKSTAGDLTDTGTTVKILEFPFVNDDMRLVFSNDTAIAADGVFTGYMRLETLI
jgi:hypothetical protein